MISAPCRHSLLVQDKSKLFAHIIDNVWRKKKPVPITFPRKNLVFHSELKPLPNSPTIFSESKSNAIKSMFNETKSNDTKSLFNETKITSIPTLMNLKDLLDTNPSESIVFNYLGLDSMKSTPNSLQKLYELTTHIHSQNLLDNPTIQICLLKAIPLCLNSSTHPKLILIKQFALLSFIQTKGSILSQGIIHFKQSIKEMLLTLFDFMIESNVLPLCIHYLDQIPLNNHDFVMKLCIKLLKSLKCSETVGFLYRYINHYPIQMTPDQYFQFINAFGRGYDFKSMIKLYHDMKRQDKGNHFVFSKQFYGIPMNYSMSFVFNILNDLNTLKNVFLFGSLNDFKGYFNIITKRVLINSEMVNDLKNEKEIVFNDLIEFFINVGVNVDEKMVEVYVDEFFEILNQVKSQNDVDYALNLLENGINRDRVL